MRRRVIAEREDRQHDRDQRDRGHRSSDACRDVPAPALAVASLDEPLERELRIVEQRREPLEHVEPLTAHADSTALRFISARARVVSERTEEAPMPSISPASSAG